MKTAQVKVDPKFLMETLFGGAFADANELRMVSTDQDGTITLAIRGANVPDGLATAVVRSVETVGGGRAVVFEGLKGRE